MLEPNGGSFVAVSSEINDKQVLTLMKKRILINANTADLPLWRGEGYVSGVGRSTSCLLSAIDKLRPKKIEIIACKEGLKYIFVKSRLKNIRYLRIFPERFAKFCRKALFRNYIYHYPNNYFAQTLPDEPFIITVHDTMQYEKALHDNNIRLLRIIEDNVRNCICIITCSRYSQRKIVEHFPFATSKVFVIPWGVDTLKFKIMKQNEVDDVTRKYGISKPYFISVSCKGIRKNINMLLNAFKLYIQRGGELALVLLLNTVPQNIIDKYHKELSDRRIIFLPYVSDEELVSLYNGANCTLFPSLEEGFGFPILESLACGTPVLTCKNSSLEEIGSSLAVYGPESSPEAFADLLFEVENMKNALFTKRALKYVARFTWEGTAQQYIALYEEILGT